MPTLAGASFADQQRVQVNRELQSSFALLDAGSPLVDKVAASLRRRTDVPAIDTALAAEPTVSLAQGSGVRVACVPPCIQDAPASSLSVDEVAASLRQRTELMCRPSILPWRPSQQQQCCSAVNLHSAAACTLMS